MGSKSSDVLAAPGTTLRASPSWAGCLDQRSQGTDPEAGFSQLPRAQASETLVKMQVLRPCLGSEHSGLRGVRPGISIEPALQVIPH